MGDGPGLGFHCIRIERAAWLRFFAHYGMDADGPTERLDDGGGRWRLPHGIEVTAAKLSETVQGIGEYWVRIDGFIGARDEAWQHLESLAAAPRGGTARRAMPLRAAARSGGAA